MALKVGDRVAALSFELSSSKPAVEGLVTKVESNGDPENPSWAVVNWEDGKYTDEWYLEGQDFSVVKKDDAE